MSMPSPPPPPQPEPADRERLIGLAYRMLGTLSEAEDAVQEAAVRWYRMPAAERLLVANPAGWFTRVVSRICLDVLSSARVRRETYVGPWLPEPLPAGVFADQSPDPVEDVLAAESLSVALLTVMEFMSPAERVAFVLHDVFAVPFTEVADVLGRSVAASRKLASSARSRVQGARRTPVDRRLHAQVVEAFGQASRNGELKTLASLLDPSVILTSDGGGVVRVARNQIIGPDRVSRFLLGILAKWPELHLTPRATADGSGFVLLRGEEVAGVVTLDVGNGRITQLWVQWNPAKLTRWTHPDPQP